MSILLAALLMPQGLVRDAPKDWKLLRSEHFDLHYPDDALLHRARDFAGWLEDARKDLAARTGIEPPRVHVFLYRSFHDMLQSSYLATTRPLSARIREPALRESGRKHAFCRPNHRSRALALAEPLRDRMFLHCQASDRWNAWFARHELVHHFMFENVYGFRMPSQDIALKNPLVPWWYWEGGADYFSGLFDSAKDQTVRDIASEELYRLAELFFPDVLNPYDYRAVYTQGSYFWRYVEERHGREQATALFKAYGNTPLVPAHHPLEKTLGRPRNELEADCTAHFKAHWEKLLEGRGAPTERLTDTRAYYRRRTWGGRWSPDGKHLAWISDADVWPELYVDGRGLLGRQRRGIDTGYLTAPPSWSPDGKRLVTVEWSTNEDQLLIVNLEGGLETIELEDFDELYDPCWAPDGERIAFAALKDGTGDLYVLHLADRRVERLTEDRASDRSPAWSPDGRLAWIKETSGRTVLHVLGQGPVTKSWALMKHPRWSRDGKRIVVAADVGGVYDAFEIDPATGAARRLTRFRGGVSHPDYHPDGSLVITYFEKRGEDLYRVVPEPQDEPGFDEEERRGWYDAFARPEPRGEPAEKSRVWGVNWLMFPVTSTSLVMPGLEFEFGDRDAENSLVLGGAADQTGWTSVARIANTRWRPTVGATALASSLGSLREKSAGPFVDLPLWSTISTGAGWTWRERKEVQDDGPDFEFIDGGPNVSMRFSNQTYYQPRDPAWGFALGGTMSWYTEAFGGDRRLKEYYAFVEASSDLLGEDWILWSRLTYEERDADRLLRAELLEIEDGVRGAEDLEGTEMGTLTLELRFPIARDLLWKPFDFMGLGEWLILKDFRGFAFGQAGYAGTKFEHSRDDDYGAASAGLGLRLDLSLMATPVLHGRAPIRLEGWWAIVGQDEKDPRGAAGFGFVVGF